MKIPGVAEGDIRASLLKGEVKIKILAREIVVLCSDIDLTQYNDINKTFLMSAGIINGLGPDIQPGNLSYTLHEHIPLIGTKNSINRIFTTPHTFINGLYNGNEFKIIVTHNGIEMFENIDFTISESVPGAGFNTITFLSRVPNNKSLIYASYATKI
jgi:hypothetical protein